MSVLPTLYVALLVTHLIIVLLFFFYTILVCSVDAQWPSTDWCCFSSICPNPRSQVLKPQWPETKSQCSWPQLSLEHKTKGTVNKVHSGTSNLSGSSMSLPLSCCRVSFSDLRDNLMWEVNWVSDGYLISYHLTAGRKRSHFWHIHQPVSIWWER